MLQLDVTRLMKAVQNSREQGSWAVAWRWVPAKGLACNWRGFGAEERLRLLRGSSR